MTHKEIYSKENLAKLKVTNKRLDAEMLLMREEGQRYPNLGVAFERMERKYK